MGPGSPEHLTRAAERALREADCLVVAKRHLALAGGHGNVVRMEGLDEALVRIGENLKKGSVAVAVSGDAGIFSFMPRLQKFFSGFSGLSCEIEVIPGVSALQSLCAALGETWDDVKILSVHGANALKRDDSPSKIAGLAAHHKKTAFFCGPSQDPAWVCRVLAERELRVEVAIGERLSYPEARVVQGNPSELCEGKFDPLSVMMARNADPLPLFPPRPKDAEFLRSPSIPMTRQEVRTLILDKLSPAPDSVVWDIGAGTGSVAVACGQLCPYGEVHAVERSPEAVRLLNANREKFRAYNLFVHEGGAEKLLDEKGNKKLPRPTHIFIGGSGGELRQILGHIEKLGGSERESKSEKEKYNDEEEKITLVVSGVTLQTIGMAFEILSGGKFENLDVTQLSVSRSKAVGGSVILAAQNPVTLLSAQLR